MTLNTPHAPISGARRAARLTVAAGLAAALAAAAAVPAFAADGASDGDPVPVKSSQDRQDKLGTADAERLAEAEAKGEKTVTLLVATKPGSTEQVAKQLDGVKGGSVGKTHDKLGYVRATLPTPKADAAIKKAAKLSSVHAIDLSAEIKLDDPTPGADAAKGAKRGAKGTYPAPSEKTPAKNPYNPSFETGAVDFVKKNPKADGRGITIGIIDSGVDVAHPALQKTTTGERKIVDWVTATDPIVDRDGTWRRMTNPVSGPEFTFADRTWKAPEGDFQVNVFAEAATKGGDMDGDLNRDGDTTDTWGVLYDADKGTVTVDLDNDGDFTNDKPMKPYKDGFQIGYFGEDDPATEVAERIPFVVEIRKDVPTDPYGGDWVGKKADFVNIGVIEGSHGTHVAGITAANSLFGGEMNGAAPGAKLVSSRACTWSGGCTSAALTEGMIDLVVNRGVDIVNMSIGGLPALNDGNNARAELYTRLIDDYGVQLVISAGNSGPGANTIGDPSLADKVISVGASVSKETWAANYGSAVKRKYAMMPFSSRGPREDGGFTPTITAPGASINTIQTWAEGQPVAEAGYDLPAGYGMLQGTSMSSPQAAGASALLLSAAKQKNVDLPPAKLRTALTSTATQIKGAQAYEQGSGLINIQKAWKSIRWGATAHGYTVKAPVDTALDQHLTEPGFGTGLYDREGGLKVGERKTYDVTITRTTGPKSAVWHKLSFKNNHDRTFGIKGFRFILLPRDKPVTVKVTAKPRKAGLSSAILEVNDLWTKGVDKQILTTVVASEKLAKPSYSFSASGKAVRNLTTSYFVTVPEGAKTLEVAMSGLKKDSQTRFISLHPYGVPMDSTSTIHCYPNYEHPTNTCRPDLRSYANPQPGVWEIEVESRRTSPLLKNPYKLDVSVLGVEFDPAEATLDEAKIGTPAKVEWKGTNTFAAIDGTLKGGSLGSSVKERPSIKDGASQERKVTIGEGVELFDIKIGKVSDASADLDLAVFLGDKLVGQSAGGDSEERVTLTDPAAGEYTIVVDGYAVPAGETDYDYLDVYYAPSLGELKVDKSATVKLGNGESAQLAADVVVAGAAPEGRQFVGELQVLNARGTAAGVGSVTIEKVTP
ncbi:S8 family serine peptidase [Streptomyces apocyni]|uniref:S8 family serine peptidase n=1 Tax=Streptomyces apocyni TaxID=2654677 RepID=UPI0012EA48CF|nr:S8 family serine peptidase [Streptomyces apocyni]